MKTKIPIVRLVSENVLVEKRVFSRFKKAVRNSAFTLGPSVAGFESSFAAFCDAKYCVGVSSGTDALHVALLAAGMGQNDEVITTPVTYTSTSLAIAYCGARPVYVDTDSFGNIDAAQVESAITPRTKAILVVHLYGRACDLLTLRRIAKKHRLHLIDDCAHAHGATFKGKKIGGLTDVSCFSFYPTKNLGAWGDAGAITTNNRSLADRARLFKGYGERRKNESLLLGHNQRLDALQAIVLEEKLAFVPRWNSRRKAAARVYTRALRGVGDIEMLPYSEECSYYVFPVRTKRRDELQRYLAEHDIETIVHYPRPMHLQPCFRYLGYQRGDFPNAERHTRMVMSLPLHSHITLRELERVVAVIRAFFAREA